jgi:hypothetical protein
VVEDARRRVSAAAPQRFSFDFDPAHRRAAAVFGIRPSKAWVEIGETTLEARYGPWHVETPLTNVTAVEITGPYAYFKTAGPARLAVTDRGLTFASNGRRGVLMLFATPITGLDPAGLIHHPELTVTVADVEGFAAALRDRIA